MNKILYTLTIFLLVSGTADSDELFTLNVDTYCDGTGWVAYRDEKCFKLIKRWATRDEAKDICAQDSSQLVSIKTADEQTSLTEFVFETSQVNFNIWIGAKRLSDNIFVWDDSSEINFANWDQTYPTDDVRKGCVVMQSELIKKSGKTSENINGKWRDTICDSVNYVVCQKLPKWSFTKVQQELLDTRKELKDSNFQLTQELVDTKSELSQTKIRLTNVESNPVPIGFIYVQLSNQPEPQTLWPVVQWKDVTSEYAGLFFRAEGGGSAQFGTAQDENAPRVTEVAHEYNDGSAGANCGWCKTTLNVGDKSSGFGVYSGSNCGNLHYALRFYMSGGEIRPRNEAIRIWKRVN